MYECIDRKEYFLIFGVITSNKKKDLYILTDYSVFVSFVSGSFSFSSYRQNRKSDFEDKVLLGLGLFKRC